MADSGILDFLFNGSPPPQTTSYSSTSTNVPDWYAAYTQGLLAKSNAIAAEPYQAYTGPRVADFTAPQQQAFDQTTANAGNWQPNLNQAGALTQAAAGVNSSSAAAPYINQAAQTAPGALSAYMSPYTANVTDAIARLGNQNLLENVLPQVQDQFVGAGQLGSTRNSEFMSRALRDNQQAISNAQAQALESGYSEAGNLFNSDQSRLAGLGQLSGQLASDTANRQLTAGQNLGALAQTQQSLGLKDAAALEAVGSEQQQQAQKNLDTAYQQFTEQRDYPKTQATFLNQQLRGLQTPTSTTGTTTAPASSVGPSPLAQLAGAGLSAAAISSLLGKARGGRVVIYARGGRVPGPLSYVRRAA